MSSLERRTLAEQVYDSLRAAILDDEFLPGAELQEPALAERYQVSRGPVREALRMLSSDGLVSIIPRRGARVRALTRQDFLGVYQVREVLESLAVKLAVPRLTQAHLDELRGYLEEIERASEVEELSSVLRANRAFHQLFVQQSGNLALQAAYQQVRGLIARYQRRSMALRGGMSTLAEEHRVIYEAAVARDADAAAEFTRRHIRVPLWRLDDLPDDTLPEMESAALRSAVGMSGRLAGDS